MTDKIVQLIDKDNNNVFPVAGSLKQGSVNSATINNKAVTAPKINFSTFFTQTGESTLSTPSGSVGAYSHVYYAVSQDGKVGKLRGLIHTDGTTTGQSITCTTPFRPTTATTIKAGVIAQLGSSKDLSILDVYIGTDGKVTISFPSEWGSQKQNAVFTGEMFILS